jgi:hypothetical protein
MIIDEQTKENAEDFMKVKEREIANLPISRSENNAVLPMIAIS